MNLQNLKYSPVFKAKSTNALDALNNISFPHRREEKWKYSRFSKLKKTRFHNNHSFKLNDLKSLLLPILDGITIVIENGRVNKNLSSFHLIKGLIINSFSDDIEGIINSIDNYEKKYNNYFSYLNHSYLEDGIIINVENGFQIKETLNIVYVNSVEQILANTRLNISIGENSSLNLKQYFIGDKDSSNGFINHISEFNVAKSSKLKIDKFQNFEQGYNICLENITQHESSYFSLNTFSNSGKIVRNDINVDVVGEFCHTELNGVFNPSGGQYIDQHTTINHLVPNCNSFENYKGLIRENGIGVFNGKVVVHKDAQQIEAFQQNNNVLIDEDAQIFSKPELEIYADDVKCSHGSTTGQFDDEALFYLRSRGLSRSKAIDLLTSGFINEVIEKASGDQFKNFLLQKLINS
jgi:Fe-S cluster assembly protein SufD